MFSFVNCKLNAVQRLISSFNTVLVFAGAVLVFKLDAHGVEVKTADSLPPGTAAGLFGLRAKRKLNFIHIHFKESDSWKCFLQDPLSYLEIYRSTINSEFSTDHELASRRWQGFFHVSCGVARRVSVVIL